MSEYKPYKRYRVRCVETRMVFKSAAAAAKDIGCGRSAMCNHLKGIFPDIRGLHFERLEPEDD